MRILFVWFVVCSCLLTGCEEEDSSPIVILVTPNQFTTEAKAGDKIVFGIEVFANEGMVEHVRISSNDAQNGLIRLMDTSLNVGRTRFDYQYIVPVMGRDSVKMELKFEAGNQMHFTSSVRVIMVTGGDVLLAEETGYSLYSSSSSKPDAFRLSDSQLLFAKQEADSLVDFYDYHDAQIRVDSLTREWRSASGIKFVSLRGFDYPKATESAVRSAYEIGVKLSSATGIRPDDVFIIGRGGDALGVIKVIGVFDEEGAGADRYIFNLKKIGKGKAGE